MARMARVGSWLKRLAPSLWVVWLALRSVLGIPGDVDDAKAWRSILTEWGVWDVMVDPVGPFVLLVATGLTLWAWDVPSRILGRFGQERPPSPALPFSSNGKASRESFTDNSFGFKWRIAPRFLKDFDEIQIDSLRDLEVAELAIGPLCHECQIDLCADWGAKK